jgi:hypothetical protein
VVDDDREVALAAPDRDLVEPQAPQPGEQVALGLGVGHHARADPTDRAPRDPHQRGDRGLGRVDRQPRGLVLKAARELRVVARPRHRRDDHAMPFALDARRLGLHERRRHAEI